MLRSSIGARLASAGAASFLIVGLFAQAAPTLAANPARVAPYLAGTHKLAPKLISRGSVNVRDLLAHPAAKLPFNPDAAAATLDRLEASRQRLAGPSSSKGVGPNVVSPPAPDLATDSGQPAAATPVEVPGLTQAGAGGVQPANPVFAAGPDTSIESANLSVHFTDRAGNNDGSTSAPQFFELPETFGFTTYDSDPRVHFDILRQRWVATDVSWDCFTAFTGNTAMFGHGNLDFAISDSTDPFGTWTVSLFQYDDAVPDRPNFESSTDKLGLTGTFFGMGAGGGANNPGCADGSFIESDVIIMDWAQLGPNYDPAKVVTSGRGFGAHDLRLAVQDPITSPDLRLVNSFDDTANGGTTTDVVTLDFSGSASKKTIVINGFDLTEDGILPQFLDAPSPHQPGGTLTSSIATVPDSAVFSAGSLAFTSTYPCTPAGDSGVRDCIRVSILATTTAAAEPTRVGDTLLGSNGFDSSFGGIAWSGSGVLHAVYTRSSSTSDASSVEQYNLPGDTRLQWSPPQVLTAGVAAYTGGPWGAYALISQDPQDPGAVWSGDAFADASHGWSTAIHEIVVGDAGAGYVPMTPVRVLDSRDGTGLPGHIAGVFSSNVPRTFPVANTHGIPTNAVAVTGNLTVTGQTAAGFVALTPTATAIPSSSTLNFPLGDTRANNVTIALATDGSLSAVYKAVAGKHANVILDVTGYFVVGSGQTYFPLPALRILDSRSSLGAPLFHANHAQSFQVQGFGGGTIPLDATAITANLTVTGQTMPGFVALTPTPDDAPGTSTLNFPVHDNRANGLTIPINPIDGKVSAVYKAVSGTANLILDVTGYYSNIGGGLHFHALNPGRRVDTRLPNGANLNGNGLSGGQGTTPRPVAIEYHDGVPSDAAAITGNLTITGQTGAGFVAVTNVATTTPSTSTINFPLGDTRANGFTATLGATSLGPTGVYFVYEPTAGKTVQLIFDITGYFN
jgi:hypothetical protein